MLVSFNFCIAFPNNTTFLSRSQNGKYHWLFDTPSDFRGMLQKGYCRFNAVLSAEIFITNYFLNLTLLVSYHFLY